MKKLIIIISCLTALYSFSATENANHVYSPNLFSNEIENIEAKLVELETISMSSGIINVFSKDDNGAIWNKWFNGKKWSKWENLGGKISENSQISAVSWGANRIDLFVKGIDKSVYHKWWNGNKWNNGWENLGGQIPESSQISSISWGVNRIDLFVKGMDKSVHHKWWNGSKWNNGWENLGGEIPESSQISAVSWGVNRIDLFVKGKDKSVYHKWSNGSNWNNGWEKLGGEIPKNSQISSVSWGANRIDLFVKGIDKSVYHKWWNGSKWNNGWENLGGKIPESSQISSVSWGVNRIDLFVKGIDKSVYHKWSDGAGWSNDWENLVGEIPENAQISSVSWGPNRLDLFVNGMDNSVYHKWWNGQWNKGWENLGNSNVVTTDTNASNSSRNSDRISLYRETIQLQTITDLCPSSLVGGDFEFGGNGPHVTGTIRLDRSDDNTQIIAYVHFNAKETKSDFLTGRSEVKGFWEVPVYTAPDGKNINGIVSLETITKFDKTLEGGGTNEIFGDGSDGSSHFLSVDRGLDGKGFVSHMEVIGDTGGWDISTDDNCANDTRILKIIFKSIEIEFFE